MVWISGIDSIVVHLAAQAIDVDIDHVRCGIDPHAPDVIQNHGPSNYTPGIPAKIFQEGKLLRSQLKQMIAASSLMTHEIELQVRSLQHAPGHSVAREDLRRRFLSRASSSARANGFVR